MSVDPVFPVVTAPCRCLACRRLDARYPGEGRQLRLCRISSGDEPDAAPLPDLDDPAQARAGLSAPQAALSKRALAAAKPEHTHA